MLGATVLRRRDIRLLSKNRFPGLRRLLKLAIPLDWIPVDGLRSLLFTPENTHSVESLSFHGHLNVVSIVVAKCDDGTATTTARKLGAQSSGAARDADQALDFGCRNL